LFGCINYSIHTTFPVDKSFVFYYELLYHHKYCKHHFFFKTIITEKHKKIVFLNVCCVMVFYVFLCRSVCWFLYGPFCHGALKRNLSTFFTTFFLWTSLQFIVHLNSIMFLTVRVCMFSQSKINWKNYRRFAPSGEIILAFCVYSITI